MTMEPVRTIDDTDTPRPGPREVPVDPHLDDDADGPTTSLDELRSELQDDVDDEPFALPVVARDGWDAVYRRDLDATALQRWRKASKDRHMPDGVDELAFALRILANLNVGLRRRGEDLLDDGAPLTVRSERFLELTGTATPLEATRKLYGRDGHVLSAAGEVLREAGFDDDLGAVAADPTVQRTRGSGTTRGS